MKKTVLYYICSVTLAISMLSCQKDKSANDISKLKKVEFAVKPDFEIELAPTGNTMADPNTGQPKKEYLITVEKSNAFNQCDMMNALIEKTLIYPGSVLNGAGLMKGEWNPLVLSNPYKPVDLFVDIRGIGANVANNVLPKAGNVIEKINSKFLSSAKNLNAYYPSNYTFEAIEINNAESIKKAFNIHVNIDIIKLLKVNLNYDYEKNINNKSRYVMLRLKQNIFSSGINPKYVKEWIDGDINPAQCGEYEPVYISSVDYGRIAYLLIKTEESAETVKNKFNSLLSLKLSKWGGEAGSYYENECKKYFQNEQINVAVYGGPASIVTNLEQFYNFIRLEDQASMIANALPISFTVRKVNDNAIVKFVNYYIEKKKEYR